MAQATKLAKAPSADELLRATSRLPKSTLTKPRTSYYGDSDVYVSDPEDLTGRYARPRQERVLASVADQPTSARKSRSLSPNKQSRPKKSPGKPLDGPPKPLVKPQAALPFPMPIPPPTLPPRRTMPLNEDDCDLPARATTTIAPNPSIPASMSGFSSDISLVSSVTLTSAPDAVIHPTPQSNRLEPQHSTEAWRRGYVEGWWRANTQYGRPTYGSSHHWSWGAGQQNDNPWEPPAGDANSWPNANGWQGGWGDGGGGSGGGGGDNGGDNHDANENAATPPPSPSDLNSGFPCPSFYADTSDVKEVYWIVLRGNVPGVYLGRDAVFAANVNLPRIPCATRTQAEANRLFTLASQLNYVHCNP
ncbi:hypothetical protein CPB85DRAFT_1257250 [Mucidula mucida]|nr:hypothetical protein CPB85DRAFT_1257250 [Mucidula mucida]